ncbi:reverse transcriptase domain-containing protein [Tanacetum coccineum]
MLGEHNITYRSRTSVKGQILADLLVEKPGKTPLDTSVVETLQESFQFNASNNEAEYEALIAGLRIAAHIGVRNVHVSVDSKLVSGKEENMIKYLEKAKSLVLVEVLNEKSIQGKEVTTVVEEDEPTWMTPIMEYLKDRTLPDDRKKASKLCIKARQYELLEGVLYRRSFLKPWLRKGQVFDSRYELFYEVDRGECLGDNHRQSGEEVRMGQHSMPLRPPGRNNLGQRLMDSWSEQIGAWVKESRLAYVLWAHRMMIKSSHSNTPFSLSYGTEGVIPAKIRMPTYRTAVVYAVHNDEELRLNLDLLEERREHAAICETKAKLKMTKYYNARVQGVTFRPRDYVYHSNHASHAVDGGKLGPKWEGPYEVTEALGDGAYMLRSMDETVLPPTWNIANLKKCYL